MMRVDDPDESSSSSVVAAAVVKPPGWLEGLMRETFFASCLRHQHRRKNEKNIFCLHCCLSFCLHCLPSHPSNHHPLLQVRRYVYHDVVRLEDLEKLIDCSYIQGYTINGAKVIFLNERAQSIRSTSISSTTSSSSKGSANFCLGCCRILQDPYLFCSLSCKVVYQREDLSSIIYDHNNNNITTFESLHDHMAGPDVDPQNHQYPTHGPVAASISTTDIIHMNIHDHDHPPKGKNKSKIRRGFLSDDLPLMISNRRKGAPRRSPLS